MNFAEDIAWIILIVCAITYPLYALFFVLAHFYKKKTQRGSGCTVFLKATVCPADVKMYRMTQICLLCVGWLMIVGTPIACFLLEYFY